jgi:hypothetical protein
MNELLISYCFFTPKSLHKEMRFWDVYNNYDRYWYNIPALMAVNTIVYPNAKIKIHLSEEIKENPLFEILDKISTIMSNVELVFLPYEYTNTEPTMWRYKPLFDKECDTLLCRDIDSLPNEDEIRATYYFLQNKEYKVHTLRTHTNHGSPATIILAGLCGYRPNEIPFIQNITFDTYYNHFKSMSWGLDQNSLINLFVRDQNWISQNFLDSPISTEYHRVPNAIIPCKSFNQDFYRENVELDIDTRLIEILNNETKWGGEPTNLRGINLNKLLDLDIEELQKMKLIIQSCSDDIKNFYLGNV